MLLVLKSFVSRFTPFWCQIFELEMVPVSKNDKYLVVVWVYTALPKYCERIVLPKSRNDTIKCALIRAIQPVRTGPILYIPPILVPIVYAPAYTGHARLTARLQGFPMFPLQGKYCQCYKQGFFSLGVYCIH